MAFRGDISVLHTFEGHKGYPYWINNYDPDKPYHTGSGVTLDPGVDLGYVEPSLFEEAYHPLVLKRIWLRKQYEELTKAFGLKGLGAKRFLDRSAISKTIRIGRRHATNILSIVSIPYWENIVDRFPELDSPVVPDVVHTVMLSLSYNRGSNNRHLEVLREPIEERDWETFANLVEDMQNDSIVAKRRDKEAAIVRNWLKFNKPLTKLEPKELDDIATD